MLDRYEVVTIDGVDYVRKERLDELQKQFDQVCQAKSEFVKKIYDALDKLSSKESGGSTDGDV